ncbi:MAG: carboxymuconolactone decarboxylase family protein [Acidobacteriota bacterium]
MARISRLGRSQVAGAARDAFDRKIAERGSIPNMYRVFAHRPWILSTMDAHFSAVMGSGTVPLKLKELLALQTSLANGSEYCTRSTTELAERLGASPEQIGSLLDFEDGPFDDREKAALRFGLAMTRQAAGISDEVFADVRRHFDEAEVVEIACVVGLFAYFNRFNDALRTEPTAAGEGVDS